MGLVPMLVARSGEDKVQTKVDAKGWSRRRKEAIWSRGTEVERRGAPPPGRWRADARMGVAPRASPGRVSCDSGGFSEAGLLLRRSARGVDGRRLGRQSQAAKQCPKGGLQIRASSLGSVTKATILRRPLHRGPRSSPRRGQVSTSSPNPSARAAALTRLSKAAPPCGCCFADGSRRGRGPISGAGSDEEMGSEPVSLADPSLGVARSDSGSGMIARRHLAWAARTHSSSAAARP